MILTTGRFYFSKMVFQSPVLSTCFFPTMTSAWLMNGDRIYDINELESS